MCRAFLEIQHACGLWLLLLQKCGAQAMQTCLGRAKFLCVFLASSVCRGVTDMLGLHELQSILSTA